MCHLASVLNTKLNHFCLLADLPVGNGNAWGSSNRGPRTEWSVTTPHDRPVAADKAPQSFSPDGDNLIKMVVLGAPGVGKTSIIQVSRRFLAGSKSQSGSSE